MQTQSFKQKSISTTLIILEEGQVRTVNLNSREHWTLGRESAETTPNIPLKSIIASRKHGEFFFIEDQLFYVDQGSYNGTFHNGKKITPGLGGRANPIMIDDGDVLRIDYEDLSTPDERGVWMQVISGDVDGNWVYYPLTGKEITIGRDSRTCDIVQNLPYVSSQHAKINKLDDNYYISDCNSQGGTYLNGEKVTQPMLLRDKDSISICNCHFIFTDVGLIYNDKSPSTTSL